MSESPDGSAGLEAMSPYERARWDELNAYWSRRSNARGTPKWVLDGAHRVADTSARAARKVVSAAPEPVKDAARKVGDRVADEALRPALTAAASLLELIDDWAVELNDPERVVKLARKRGLDIEDVTELSKQELRDCDRVLGRHMLASRTYGSLEGAAMGVLAMVPVVGFPVSVTADVIVMQIMSASIATRVAYSYGFDAMAPDERDFISMLATGALAKQVGKAGPLNQAQKAHHAVAGRVKWSPKLRKDHELVARLERLMAKWYPKGKVPVAHMGKALSIFAVLVSAGVNAQALGSVARHAQRYCQTRFLAQKYGVELPPALRDKALAGEDSDEGAADEPGES